MMDFPGIVTRWRLSLSSLTLYLCSVGRQTWPRETSLPPSHHCLWFPEHVFRALHVRKRASQVLMSSASPQVLTVPRGLGLAGALT